MAASRPLSRIKVLELAGLAPAPLAGMILADFGATVVRIDRVGNVTSTDRIARGKKSIAVNLKSPRGVEVIRKLSRNADILIEPFRPGVMEKLGIGPDLLCEMNERLIYGRLTGFGQSGPLSPRAGHDINYIAVSGILSMLGRKSENPYAPFNLIADFAGGSFVFVVGVMMALIERNLSGKGQVIDSSMVEGSAYLSSFLHRSKDLPIWFGSEKGTNMLDSGAPFYETYKTKDGKYMSVGALEGQFYRQLIEGLGLEKEFSNQIDMPRWPEMKKRFAEVFASKSQSEWNEIFTDKDACVFPVVDFDEAQFYPHNQSRQSFMENKHTDTSFWEPKPAPRLSRTPAYDYSRPQPKIGQHTVDVLLENGFDKDEIASLIDSGVVEQHVPTPSL